MQGGNGHKPVRGLPFGLGGEAKPAPRGPFSGALIIAALEAEGWVPEETASDEWMVWRRIGTDTRVLMNPHWERVWEGDPIFRTLCRDMGLSPEELVALLEGRTR